MENRLVIIGIVLAAVVAVVFVLHVVHHRLFCRYKKDPQRSHCSRCGHREICRKYHHKKDMAK